MIKPTDYDSISTSGEGNFTPIELGGHYLIIKQVNVVTLSNGSEQTVVLYDFAENDKQKGLITEDFKNDTRADKKWPGRGTRRIFNEYQGETTRDFKTFITCFEHSNDCTVKWVEDNAAWAQQFKGKKIGGCFGLKHYVSSDGKEKVGTEIRWWLSTDGVSGAQIPNEKFLSDKEKTKLIPDTEDGANGTPDFMQVPDTLEEDLPFA